MSRLSLRLSVRPRPVPPYLLVLASSATLNFSNRLGRISAGMPMPVSRTLTTSSSPAAPVSRGTPTGICPFSGNLAALLRSCEIAWRTLVGSQTMPPKSGAACIESWLPLASAAVR